MQYLTNEDLNFLNTQSQDKMNLVIYGMTSLIDMTNEKVQRFENQKWYQRMLNTLTGKNKATVSELARNRDKINIYLAEAISCLYDQNMINENIILSLGNQLNNLCANQIETKRMLGAFVTKLNQKIESVDNFHMLVEEINHGVYSNNTIIASVCLIISKLDMNTLQDPRKMDIILRALEQNDLLTDNEVLFVDILQEFLMLSDSDCGIIAMLFDNAKENYVTEIAVETICEYYLLSEKIRKMKNKKAIVESVLNANQIDLSYKLSNREFYQDFINCYINSIQMKKVKGEIESSIHIENDLKKEIENNNPIVEESDKKTGTLKEEYIGIPVNVAEKICKKTKNYLGALEDDVYFETKDYIVYASNEVALDNNFRSYTLWYVYNKRSNETKEVASLRADVRVFNKSDYALYGANSGRNYTVDYQNNIVFFISEKSLFRLDIKNDIVNEIDTMGSIDSQQICSMQYDSNVIVISFKNSLWYYDLGAKSFIEIKDAVNKNILGTECCATVLNNTIYFYSRSGEQLTAEDGGSLKQRMAIYNIQNGSMTTMLLENQDYTDSVFCYDGCVYIIAREKEHRGLYQILFKDDMYSSKLVADVAFGGECKIYGNYVTFYNNYYSSDISDYSIYTYDFSRNILSKVTNRCYRKEKEYLGRNYVKRSSDYKMIAQWLYYIATYEYIDGSNKFKKIIQDRIYRVNALVPMQEVDLGLLS